MGKVMDENMAKQQDFMLKMNQLTVCVFLIIYIYSGWKIIFMVF